MIGVWAHIGQDYVYMDAGGAITAIVKPVRNQLTGKIRNSNYEAHKWSYDRATKSTNQKGA